MSVRSRRLWGPVRVIGGGFQPIFTVPLGRTAIIRTLYISNPSDTADWPISLRIPTAASPGVLFQGVVDGFTPIILTDIILNPGDQLSGRSNAVGTPGIDTYGFGALLLGEPS